MKLFSWLKRNRWEARMDAELQFHFENQVADYIVQGLSREEAEVRARREFGAMELAKDECRDHKPAVWLDHFIRDLRYAVHSLQRTPGFTIAAVGTLALGIGANAAIFQLLNAVRLRSLPVKDPQQLALVYLADRTGIRGSQSSYYPALTNPIWERFRDTQQVFDGVLAWGSNEFGLGNGGESRTAKGLFVNGEFFRVLGVQPLIGRVLTAEDDRPGCGANGAVISYAFWQREFGGDPDIINRKLTLNYHEVPVLGVTPAGFTGLEVGRSYDVAVPICSQAALWSEGNWLHAGTVWWLTVMGRLKPGQTLEQARTELLATTNPLFAATLPSNYPAVNAKDYLKFKLTAFPAARGVSALRNRYSDPLLLLLATTGLVLLIACANIANLMLARATAREHEIALRMAIGASRVRLALQFITESAFIATLGAIAGLAIAALLSRSLIALLSVQGSELFLDLRPDARVIAFLIGIAGLTCLLFGLVPALKATRTAAGEAMKSSGRSMTASRQRLTLRQILVVAQVALSLVLLVTALLFSASLRNLLNVDAGFHKNGVLITEVDFSRMGVLPAERVAFKRNLIERIRAIPGVVSAGESSFIPLSGYSTENSVWSADADPNQKKAVHFGWIGDGYLKTLGMTLLMGRDFTDRDTLSAPRVAIVNQAFAKSLALGDNPVGKRFRREATPSEPEVLFEIVGLVRDSKYGSLREQFGPIAFLCTAQYPEPDPFAQVVLRSGLDLAETTVAMRRVISQLNPALKTDFHSLETTVAESLLRERLMATLSGFFGALAALIATVGLYGVMSYLVVRRTNEIGLRIALGADRKRILALILRQAGVLLAVGIVLGAVLSVAAANAAGSMLFGLKAYDPAILLLAASLLAAVTVTASFIPAQRAAALDPMVALREE